MKKRLLFAALAILVAGSCRPVKELLRFNIHFARSVTIPQGGVPGVTFQVASDVPVDENTFKHKGTALSLVKEIRIEGMKLTIVDPSNETFRFLESINVYISKADGSDEQKIAFKDPVDPDIGNVLELETNNGVLLDNYFKADRFRFRIEGRQRGVLENDLEVKVDFTFSVVADPL